MDTATLSCEWTNQRAGSQLNMHTYDDTRRSIFCVNRDCLIFEVHQIISWLLRDFFIFSSKKRTFLAKYRLFGEKEDLICVVFFQKSPLCGPKSSKEDPVGITAITRFTRIVSRIFCLRCKSLFLSNST